MLKKTLYVGAGLLLLSGLMFGRSLPSYVHTAWNKANRVVKDATPVSFDLERLRDMVKGLDPEIRSSMQMIAQEEIGVENLKKEITSFEERLGKDKSEIVRLKSDLDSGNNHFVYSGRSYTEDQVRGDLKSRFTRYETNETTLVNHKKILSAREQGLMAARAKLDEVISQRRQMEAEIASLEARQKSVEVAQMASEVSIDDSHLSRTRELLDEVKSKIEVSERLVGAEGAYQGQINLNEPENDDISARIAEKFGMGIEVEVATKSEK